MNGITTTFVNGGLGRKAAGKDHISALLFAAALPGAFGSNKLMAFNTIEEVENAGILEGNATYGEAWYHAAQFFRLAPGAKLWIGMASPTYAEVLAATAGEVRQIGIFFTDFATLTSAHQVGAALLDTGYGPAVIVAGYNGVSLAPSAAIDLATLNCPQVSVVMFGDGSGKGAALAAVLTKPYIPAVGAVLGCLAAASVGENIGWVDKFNLSDGVEYEVIRMSDGTLKPTDAVLSALDVKRYVVARKHIGTAGTYLADSPTAIIGTHDLAYLETNRVLQKAKRGIREVLLHYINAPLKVDASTGKLAPPVVKNYETVVRKPLNEMQAAEEVSGFDVYVNPDQNVISTGVLLVAVVIVPIGVARQITVNLSFAVRV